MNLTSIGDLAQSIMLRSRSNQIKQSIETLSQELTTGLTTRVTERLGGDFSYLSDIERNLSRLDGYAIAVSEATLFSTAAQSNLERLHDLSNGLGNSLLSTTPSHLPNVRANLSTQANANLESAISALNGSVAGRSVFAGINTDRAPLEGADVLMTALRTNVAGLTSAAAIQTAVENWFSSPAGFEAVMYTGAADSLAPIKVGPGQEVSMPLRADDPDFRDLLRNMAISALAGDPSLALDADTQNELLRSSGEALLTVQDRMAELQADVGFAQARIDEAGVRNASARLGLQQARNALIEADPYETATRLENVQFQLESLYTVTVRNSRLSLMAFMR